MIKIKDWDYRNKLVRNKIPEIIEKDGDKTVLYKILDNDEEYKKYLFEKLYEETREALEAADVYGDYGFDKNELIEELADIQEVIQAIYAVYCIDPVRVENQAYAKRQQRGDFSDRILLVEVIK